MTQMVTSLTGIWKFSKPLNFAMETMELWQNNCFYNNLKEEQSKIYQKYVFIVQLNVVLMEDRKILVLSGSYRVLMFCEMWTVFVHFLSNFW